MTTGTPIRQRGKLDPNQVEKLIRYGMAELEKAGMVFKGENGSTVCARISPGKLAGKARDTLRAYPRTAQERFAEYVDGLVGAERRSYEKAKRDAKRAGTPGNVAP